MPKNFNFRKIGEQLRGTAGRPPSLQQLGKDPRMMMRMVLGVLLVANLVAALFAFKPWAPSQSDLEQQISGLRQQIQQRRTTLDRLRKLVSKVQTGRQETDHFFSGYFLDSATAYSDIVSELTQAAEKAGIHPKEHSYELEPVEGSDTLSMMTVTGSYEGTYDNLMQFVNHLDRSSRFLILDSLQAVPLEGGNQLGVRIKLNTFVRERPAPPSQIAQLGGTQR